MKYLLAAALTIGMAGCAVEQGVATTWTELNVGTLHLELEDEERHEVLSFRPDGMVTATIGLKKGPVAGPILYWHIDQNRLVITDLPVGGTVHDVLKDPRLEKNRLSVAVSGASRRTYVVRRSAA
jgi:hypothetical protein